MNKCICGPSRRPTNVNPATATVNCGRCSGVIVPGDDLRIKYFVDSGYDVRQQSDGKQFFLQIVMSGQTVAKGNAETISDAVTALQWSGAHEARRIAAACDALSEAAVWDPTEKGAGEECLPCENTAILSRGIMGASKEMTPGNAWTVEAYNLTGLGRPAAAIHDGNGHFLVASVNDNSEQGEKDLAGLAYMRKAAPIVANRAIMLASILQQAVDAMAAIPDAPEGIRSALKAAGDVHVKPGGATVQQGAPFCPLCGRFMRPFIVQLPDAKSGQSGRIPGNLVKMVQVHAWLCKCKVTV